MKKISLLIAATTLLGLAACTDQTGLADASTNANPGNAQVANPAVTSNGYDCSIVPRSKSEIAQWRASCL